MFKIVDKRVNYGKTLYGVLDTKDGKVDYFTKDDLIKIVSTLNIKVYGTERNRVSPSKSDFERVGYEVLKALKEKSSCSDANFEHHSDGSVSLFVRDWGKWRIPPYELQEHDNDYSYFEDYDWMELTPESSKALSSIVSVFNKKYPYLLTTFSAEEKNWVNIGIRRAISIYD